MANENNLPGLKVDGSGQAGCWIAPGHDDVTAIKVFRLADVQQEEGTVNDRSGDGVLLVEGGGVAGKRKQGLWRGPELARFCRRRRTRCRRS